MLFLAWQEPSMRVWRFCQSVFPGPEGGHEVEADNPEEGPLHRVEGAGEGQGAGRNEHTRPEQLSNRSFWGEGH